MLALLGPNGCGKSTTMKVLSGAIPASSGHVTGSTANPAAATTRAAVTGYVPDTRGSSRD